MVHRDALLASRDDRLERNLEVDLDIGPPQRSAAAATSTEEALEEPAPAQAPELESEVAEEVVEIDAAEQVLRAHAADARETARVVLGALLRVPEHRVRFSDLLEALLGVGLLAAIGVVAQR
jgi:hypothetical protein